MNPNQQLQQQQQQQGQSLISGYQVVGATMADNNAAGPAAGQWRFVSEDERAALVAKRSG